MNRTSWLQHYPAQGLQKRTMLVVPYAGAGPAVFRLWSRALGDGMGVCAAQLPGRPGRPRDARSRCAREYASQIAAVWLESSNPHRSSPVFIYGHSMGAIIAFEVARILERECRVPALIVSGRQGPQIPVTTDLYRQPDSVVRKALVEYGGTPIEVLNSEELLTFLLPLIRDDFAVTETYRSDGGKLSLPIYVSGGAHDSLVTHHKLHAWQSSTAGQVSVRWFSGGHFFIHEDERKFLQYLRSIVSDQSWCTQDALRADLVGDDSSLQ